MFVVRLIIMVTMVTEHEGNSGVGYAVDKSIPSLDRANCSSVSVLHVVVPFIYNNRSYTNSTRKSNMTCAS